MKKINEKSSIFLVKKILNNTMRQIKVVFKIKLNFNPDLLRITE